MTSLFVSVCFLRIRRLQRLKRTDTLFPSTTLSRSDELLCSIEHPATFGTRRPAGNGGKIRSRRRFSEADSTDRFATGHLAEPGFFLRLGAKPRQQHGSRSEEHTSELQSLMRIPYAVFCSKNNTKQTQY